MKICAVSMFVAPAKAGAQSAQPHLSIDSNSVCCTGWIPAFAGMTALGCSL
jgi:hypothetical protein